MTREYLPNEADCPVFVNADLIAAGLSPFAPEVAAIRAGRLMLEEIRHHTRRHASFAFETTTLAGRSYARLIVANKFQTGFDQPLLAGMFLDKPVVDRNAVADRVALEPLPRRQEGRGGGWTSPTTPPQSSRRSRNIARARPSLRKNFWTISSSTAPVISASWKKENCNLSASCQQAVSNSRLSPRSGFINCVVENDGNNPSNIGHCEASRGPRNSGSIVGRQPEAEISLRSPPRPRAAVTSQHGGIGPGQL
jgi:hypothetical protein